MAKSKIIKELVSGKITTLQALDRLLVILTDIDDKNTLSWVKCEKKGYEAEDDVPSYRYVKLMPTGTYHIYQRGGIQTFRDHPLPTLGIPNDVLEIWKNFPMRQSIAELVSVKENIDKGHKVGIPFPPEQYALFEEGTNIEISSAQLVFSAMDIDRIIEDIKTRILEILLLLEKNFGVLDELDIEIENYDSEEVDRLKKAVKEIVDGKSSGNTYIITKSKFKNSNIGDGNVQEKNSDVEISSTVTVDGKKKKGFFSKLINFFRRK